jgi:lipoprotein-anchoring transpeptidase ErfK/SrfK
MVTRLGRGFALAVLAAALAAPSAGAAREPSSYPAIGPIVVPSVVVRKNPNVKSKKVLLLRDYRFDLLTQYVMAVSGKRIGVIPARKAHVVLKNTGGTTGLVLSARTAGRSGNRLSVAVVDESGTHYLVVFRSGGEIGRVAYTPGDVAGLAAAVNAAGLPLTATQAGTGTLALVAGKALAGGKRGNPGKLWYRISLPIRPFNQKGWIPARAAKLRAAPRTIVVNRTTHWLEVFDRSHKRVFRTRVATGRPDRPTPRGLFYIAAKYVPPENAAVTAFALELSAPAGLPDFDFGGTIGIHGTHLLNTLGHNASNGCIRVAPSAALRLKKIIPLGTPIRVTG